MAYSAYTQKKSIFIKETINEKKQKQLVSPQKVSYGCLDVKFSQALWSSHFYDKEAKGTEG